MDGFNQDIVGLRASALRLEIFYCYRCIPVSKNRSTHAGIFVLLQRLAKRNVCLSQPFGVAMEHQMGQAHLRP